MLADVQFDVDLPVAPAYFRMPKGFLVSTVRDDLALVHHGKSLQKVFHVRNLVLDDQDALFADVPAQHIQYAPDLRFGQAGKRFIQQQHLGLGQDRHRDLQASLLPQAEMFDLSIAQVLQVEGLQDRENLLFLAVALAGAEDQAHQRRFSVRSEKREHQVVDDAQIVEG